jgi:hypothetical protein
LVTRRSSASFWTTSASASATRASCTLFSSSATTWPVFTLSPSWTLILAIRPLISEDSVISSERGSTRPGAATTPESIDTRTTPLFAGCD